MFNFFRDLYGSSLRKPVVVLYALFVWFMGIWLAALIAAGKPGRGYWLEEGEAEAEAEGEGEAEGE